jgi:ribosome assembly protein 1
MAVEAGPLMREPMHGVGFCVETIDVNFPTAAAALSAAELSRVCASPPAADTPGAQGGAAILTGQLISELREAMHLAALSLPVRIVEPVYKCDLQCDQSQLGNLYAVLSQRRGEVTAEDIIEGTTLFLLSAHLPVQASFGFAQQLLKKTSGLGTAPQLSFSHWSRLEEDPFW